MKNSSSVLISEKFMDEGTASARSESLSINTQGVTENPNILYKTLWWYLSCDGRGRHPQKTNKNHTICTKTTAWIILARSKQLQHQNYNANSSTKIYGSNRQEPVINHQNFSTKIHPSTNQPFPRNQYLKNHIGGHLVGARWSVLLQSVSDPVWSATIDTIEILQT